MNKSTKILNAGLATAIVLVVGGSYAAFAGGTTKAQVSTTTVQRGTVVSTVTASGTVISPADVGVSFTNGGQVTAIDVKVGDSVYVGERLATVDATSANQGLASAKSQLASAQSQLAKLTTGPTTQTQQANAAALKQSQAQVNSAQISLTNAEELQAANKKTYSLQVSQAQSTLTSAEATEKSACGSAPASAACTSAKNQVTSAQQSLDSAKQSQKVNLLRDQQSVTNADAQLASAQASLNATQAQQASANQPASSAEIAAARESVRAASAQVATAQLAVDNTVLYAPAAGTVASISGAVGDQTSASASAATGTSTTVGSNASGFVVITNVARLQVQAQFAEADAAKITTGKGARVSFAALSDRTVNGDVLRVDPLPKTSNNLTTYTVTIALSEVPKELKAGMSATAAVIAAEAGNVLYVTSSAVNSLGGTNSVTVVGADGKQKSVTVRVGVKGDSTTEISGVPAGTKVVLTSSTGSSGGFPTSGLPGGLGGLGGGLGAGR
jgi:multidrug efflux pump subunit AcrA (membrane-fusion protein)